MESLATETLPSLPVEFSLGRVLGRSFGVWMKNFVPFTILMVVAYSPSIAYSASVLGGDLDPDSVKLWSQINPFLMMLLGLFGQAAITYGVFHQLRGERAALGRCIAVGLGRMFPVFGTTFLAGLATAGAAMLLVVPGLIVMCMVWVAVPVSVVEQPGVTQSIKRSSELTKGHRWAIFGIILIIGAIGFGIDRIAAAMFDATLESDVKALSWLTLGTTALMGTWGACAAAVGYHDLRVAKDGVGTEDLVRVFD